MKRLLMFILFLTFVLKGISQDTLWHKTIGGTGNITPFKSLIDQNNNIYVIGSFTGNIKYKGIINFSASGTTSDGFLAKFKSTGALDWIKIFGGTGIDEVRAISIDPSNQHIFVGGSFQYTSSFTGGPTLTVVGTASATNFDAFIAEYDTSGNYQSVIPFATGSITDNTGQFIESIKIDNSGKLFACGYYKDNIYFTSGSLTGIATNQNYIGRFNKDGSPIWVTKVTGSTNSDRVLNVTISDNAAYWAGQYSNTMSFSTISMTNTAGLRNMFLLKTELDGTELTHREVKGAGEEITTSLTASQEGVFWGGYFNTTTGGLTIDSTASVSSSITPKPNSLGGYDFIYLKYNKDLNLVWYNVAGSTGSSTANDDFLLRTVFGEGFLVVAGKFGGNINLGSSNLTYRGGTGTDMFGLVLDKYNNIVYSIPLAGTNVDVGRTAVIDSKGNYIFIGDFKSADFKVSGATIPLDGTNSDLIIVKYKKGSLDSFSTNISCKGGATGSISVTPKGALVPPFTYTWDKEGVPFTPADPENLTGLTAGTYNLAFVDHDGFTINKTFTITEPSGTVLTIDEILTTINHVNCYGQTTGSVVLSASGGTGVLTYNKNGGAYQLSNTFSNLGAGDYSFGVKDANGCTDTYNFAITQPTTALTLSLTGTNTSGSDGTATAIVSGGTPDYSYSWNPTGLTTPTITGLSMGTYTVTVTDTKSCSISESIGISDLVATVTKKDICFGANDGKATVSVTGGTTPYSYSINNWATSQSTNIFDNLAAGSYTIDVKDDSGTPKTTSITFSLVETTTLSVTLNKTDVTCYGYQNGSVLATLSGGTTPYLYSWTKDGSPFATTMDISNLDPGDYALTVTDKNQCSDSKSSTVTSPTIINIALTKENAKCFSGQGNISGSISSSVTGGSGIYTYLWNNGNTTSGIIANPGNFYLTVTDNTGCSITTPSTAISFGSRITGNIVSMNPCFGSTNGSIEFTIANPGNGLSTSPYLWNTGQTTSVISGLTAGSYTLTVTDTKGCQLDTTRTLTISPLPVPTITGSSPVCEFSANNVYTTETGMTNYSWSVTGGTATSGGGISDNTITITWGDTGTGSVSVIYTNENGCTASTPTSKSITINTLPIPLITGTSPVCAASTDNIYTTDAGMSNYIWTVNGGIISSGGTTTDNTTTITWGADGTGSVSVNYTSGNGCSAATATNKPITINALPIVSVNPTGKTSYCQGEAISTLLTALPSGETSYQWKINSTDITGETNETYTAISGGIYSVLVFNAMGCSSSGSLEIIVNSLPVVDIAPSYDIAPSFDTIKIKTNEQYIFDAGIGFSSYLWNDGSSNQTLTVDGATFSPGDYTYWAEVSNASGCITRDTAILNVQWPSSINDEKDWSITFFPNPNKGTFMLNLAGVLSDKFEVTIHNVVGTIVFRKEYRTNSTELHELITINNYSSGIYLVKISSKNINITRKIVFE